MAEPSAPAPRTPLDVFISFRIAESHAEALSLKEGLERRGYTVFLSDFKPGEKLFVAIAEAANECALAVLLATSTYGRATNDRFDTSKELGFIIDSKKPFFLIKMCNQYEEATARFQLDSGIMWVPWTPGQPMPDDLVDKVCARLEDVRAANSSTTAGASASSTIAALASPAASSAGSSSSAALAPAPTAKALRKRPMASWAASPAASPAASQLVATTVPRMVEPIGKAFVTFRFGDQNGEAVRS